MLRRSTLFRNPAATTKSPVTSASYKKTVKPSDQEALAGRFYNQFWQYRVCQLTTSNVAAMKAAGIGSSGDQPSPVTSDIQIHGIHAFRRSLQQQQKQQQQDSKKKNDDIERYLCVVVDKNSAHAKNLLDDISVSSGTRKVSIMAGHTDPQIFHWFKQLGTVPPRSILSGTAEVLTGDLLEEVWEDTFVRHPVMHDRAHEQWEGNETKTPSESADIDKREKEEDERRMLRLSNSDWRAKPAQKERNPTPQEDIEQPIYVMKPDQYVTFRIRPEVQVWGDYANNLQRIFWSHKVKSTSASSSSTSQQGAGDVISIPEMDPLARAAPRFIKMANMARGKLVASVNINYNLKLTNLFVYSLDKNGLWAMATQETAPPPPSQGGGGGDDAALPPRESWNEFRIEYGQDQSIETEAELEWWFKGLMRMGVPETAQYDQQVESSKDSHEFRH